MLMAIFDISPVDLQESSEVEANTEDKVGGPLLDRCTGDLKRVLVK